MRKRPFLNRQGQTLGYLAQGLAYVLLSVGRKNHSEQRGLVLQHGEKSQMVIRFKQKPEQPCVLWRKAHQQVCAARGRRQGGGWPARFAQRGRPRKRGGSAGGFGGRGGRRGVLRHQYSPLQRARITSPMPTAMVRK